jgi:hypothetical protein
MGRLYVKVVQDEVITERDVELGIESAVEYEIKSGLAAGEKVLR